MVQFSLNLRDLTTDAFTDDKKVEFIHDIADAVGLDASRIFIAEIHAGSVIVHVDIVG